MQVLNQIDPNLFSYQSTPVELQIATVDFLVNGLRKPAFYNIAFATEWRQHVVINIMGEIMLVKNNAEVSKRKVKF